MHKPLLRNLLTFSLLLTSGAWCEAKPPLTAEQKAALLQPQQVSLSQPIVRVPIRVGERGEIFLPVSFNGRTIECQLDTGTFLVSWDDRYNIAGRLFAKGKAMFVASGKMQSGKLLQIKTVAVGGAVFRNAPGMSRSYRDVDEKDQANKVVLQPPLIGWSLFCNHAIRIDYQAKMLFIGRPEALRQQRQNAYEVPLNYVRDIEKGVPSVVSARCVIADVPLNATIDTGNNSDYTVINILSWAKVRGKIVAQKGAGAIEDYEMEGRPGETFYSSSDVIVSLLTKTGKQLPTALCEVTNLPASSKSDPSCDANIGSKYLQHFIVTFDFANRMLYLEDRSGK